MKTRFPNSKPERPARPIYPAKNMSTRVNFHYANRDAKSVLLIGDFNEWNPAAHPMRRREDGWWFIEVRLAHGLHRYLLLVDGVPTLDPQATGTTRLNDTAKASVIAVS